jgi:hypothetical protein
VSLTSSLICCVVLCNAACQGRSTWASYVSIRFTQSCVYSLFCHLDAFYNPD